VHAIKSFLLAGANRRDLDDSEDGKRARTLHPLVVGFSGRQKVLLVRRVPAQRVAINNTHTMYTTNTSMLWDFGGKSRVKFFTISSIITHIGTLLGIPLFCV
jgi:hypothetical protein